MKEWNIKNTENIEIIQNYISYKIVSMLWNTFQTKKEEQFFKWEIAF